MTATGNPPPAELARRYAAEHQALVVHNTTSERAVCLKYSRLIRQEPPEYVIAFTRQLLITYRHRWQAYELIAQHSPTFRTLNESVLEELGQGIDSWWSTDSFARTLSGPAWMAGLVPDELIDKWAAAPDLWWRRAALVSTVAFNVRSHGGKGDTRRTINVCQRLVADHEDMVVKALSWALRELVYFDRQAVEGFLQEYEAVLAARVKREVGTKLKIGLKSPRRKSGS